MIEIPDYEKFREKIQTDESQYILTTEYFETKKKIIQKSGILSNFLKQIMKAIERDFPDAPKCKEGCDCDDGSDDPKLLGKTWECMTCHYKDNPEGETWCIIQGCGKPYDYRR